MTEELELLTGTVLAWHAQSGTNTIRVGDDMVCNCVSLAGSGQTFVPLDRVVLLQRHGRFFVLGKKL